jgi:hypothetical protein
MAAKKKKSAKRKSAPKAKGASASVTAERASVAPMRPGEGTYQPNGGTGIIRPG